MIEENSQRLGDRLEQMDKEIRQWSKLTKDQLLREILKLGLHDKIKLTHLINKYRDRKPLVLSLANRVKKKNGDIESVGFSFAQHGIFRERGVGKGRPVGSAAAEKAKKPWLSNTLPPSIEDLAKLLAENYADLAAEELRFLIPGVIDTKVSTR